jgi:2'-5' RNA ligase
MPLFRLFIAIETPPEIKTRLGEVRDRLKESGADVKWEPNEKLHATLKFLGATDEGLLPEIVSYIEGVARRYTPLSLKYTGVGCFPNHRAPRIVWIGMEDLKGNILALQQDTENVLVPLGFKREERPFHAHVTLGRVKSDRKIESLLRMMESVTFESQPVTIGELAIVKSELRPSGSVYTILKKIPLTADNAGAQPASQGNS